MSEMKRDPYVALAVMSYAHYIKTGRRPRRPPDLPEEMTQQKAGVFVSLHKDGNLRGCIGTICPQKESVADEIMANAVSAATMDPRFPPVREEELDEIDCSVDVLGDAEEVTSLSELDAKHYGVIVTSGKRRGLLLPDLEGVDTVEDQLAIARRKAGIGQNEQVCLERFRVLRHE